MIIKNKIRRSEQMEQKQRYSIRKFSVGAASVLIGLTFAGFMQGPTQVKADTVEPNATVEQKKTDETADIDVADQTKENLTVVDVKKAAEGTSADGDADAAAKKMATSKVEVKDKSGKLAKVQADEQQSKVSEKFARGGGKFEAEWRR